MFGIAKLANGRTPDQVADYDMVQASVKNGNAVFYDALKDQLDLVTASQDVFGILTSSANQSMDEGGGITFPVGGTVVKPTMMRVYADTLIQADVVGTVPLTDAQPGDKLTIGANADGLVPLDGTTPVEDFVVEKVLVDDGTNALKVSGYFLKLQMA